MFKLKMIHYGSQNFENFGCLVLLIIEGQSMNESSIQTQTEKMAKLTITLDIGPSDLLPLLIALLRDESGRTPASPFSREFRGFRVSDPFDLEDLLETLGRKGSGEGEEATGFEGFEEVFEAMEAFRRRARATGDDTAPPEGPEGSEGEPEGDNTPPEGQGEGTAETPEDTRLRFYFQHEGED